MKAMHPNMDDRLFDLRTKLLDFAGEAVCLPAYEEDLDNILKLFSNTVNSGLETM